MKLLTSFIILVFCLSAVVARGRIFRGTTVPTGSFLYHAEVNVPIPKEGPGAYALCGGALINKNWILSAAHCFKENEWSRQDYRNQTLLNTLYVILGKQFGANKRDHFYTNVTAVIWHENFHYETTALKIGVNDIALIRVRDVTFKAGAIQPIKLPDISYNYTNKVLSVTGSGRIYKNNTFPVDLQNTTLKVLDNKLCNEDIPGMKFDTQFCSENSLSHICSGDSGGPAVDETIGVVVGITSYTLGGRCSGWVTAVFTKVTSYLSWINDTMNANRY